MQQLSESLKNEDILSFYLGKKKECPTAKDIHPILGLQNTLKQMSHLSLAQRYVIEVCLTEDMSFSQIAEKISRNRSVISREISRNADQRSGKYSADLAHRKAQNRHRHKAKHISFTEDVKGHVITLLEQEFSPEQIVGKSKLQSIDCVSHERIYQFIWRDKKAGGQLYKQLRTKGKRYVKRGAINGSRGIIVGRIDIDKRPIIVEKKERIGDLEIDLVIGQNHKGALLTINDRATGCLRMGKVETKEARQIEAATISLLEQWKPFIQTITSDNGKEFANHKNIAEDLEIDFYFAKPYHSWQRGANENLNGLVRQYFPKKSDFTTITQSQINHAVTRLNNRPRKRFGYKTPNEMFAMKLKQEASVAFIT